MVYANPQPQGDMLGQMIGGGIYDPGALAMMQAASTGVGNLPPSPYVQGLFGASQALTGSPKDIPGVLSNLKAQQDAAAQAKIASINRAIGILQASGANAPGAVNLPLLAASGALMSGGVGPGAEFSRAALTGADAIQGQRALEQRNNMAIADLMQSAGSVPMEQYQQDLQNFQNRLKLGEEFGAQAGQEYLRQQLGAERLAGQVAGAMSKEDAAKIMATGRVTAAQLQSMRDSVQYMGPKPEDPSVGYYLNRTTGQVAEGPVLQAGAGQTSRAVADAQFLVQNGVAPDLTTAYAMVRSGVNNGVQFQKLVQQEKSILLKTPQGAQMSPEDLENAARENVVARAQAGAQTGMTAPTPQAHRGETAAASPPPPPHLRNDPGALSQARDAIKAGAPRGAVIDRLKGMGVDPSGL